MNGKPMTTVRGSAALERQLRAAINLYETATRTAVRERECWGHNAEHWREVVRVLEMALNTLPRVEEEVP